jgi:hypothetical protein
MIAFSVITANVGVNSAARHVLPEENHPVKGLPRRVFAKTFPGGHSSWRDRGGEQTGLVPAALSILRNTSLNLASRCTRLAESIVNTLGETHYATSILSVSWFENGPTSARLCPFLSVFRPRLRTAGKTQSSLISRAFAAAFPGLAPAS